MYPFFLRLSRAMAYVGGSMLTAVIILTCLSILGRQLNTLFHLDQVEALVPGLSHWMLQTVQVNEIRGSYEITESGMAFVIFAFLPWTQITSGHAIVDILTSQMGTRINRLLRTIAEVLFAVALVVIAIQLAQGMLSKMRSEQVSLFLQYPVWWGYALSVFAAGIAAIVAIYVAAVRVQEVRFGRDILPDSAGADH